MKDWEFMCISNEDIFTLDYCEYIPIIFYYVKFWKVNNENTRIGKNKKCICFTELSLQ